MVFVYIYPKKTRDALYGKKWSRRKERSVDPRYPLFFSFFPSWYVTITRAGEREREREREKKGKGDARRGNHAAHKRPPLALLIRILLGRAGQRGGHPKKIPKIKRSRLAPQIISPPLPPAGKSVAKPLTMYCTISPAPAQDQASKPS